MATPITHVPGYPDRPDVPPVPPGGAVSHLISTRLNTGIVARRP